MAYHLTPHLERMEWTDGDTAFCKKCDAAVPLTADRGDLVCAAGHRQHAANALVNGSHRTRGVRRGG